MTQPNNAVAQAIAEAKAKAAEATANLPATAPVGAAVATANAGPAPAARTYSAADMAQGALAVDAWLKVSADGLKIGDKPDLIDSIKVSIDLGAVQYGEAIKFGQNPPTYYKTYDGVRAATGGTWAEAIAKAKMADPNARPYMTCDIPMTLLEDAKSIRGTEMAKAGVKLGHATSTTNRQNFTDFIKQVQALGLNTGSSVVEVEITCERKVKGTLTWGLLKFKLLGEYVEAPEGAETVEAGASASA